jgi:hypothetical protein
MRKSVTLDVASIICLIALFATNRVALGQAGSIGGTVGKTDKSASGGQEEAKPRNGPTSAPLAAADHSRFPQCYERRHVDLGL